jgi:hypothetical protein
MLLTASVLVCSCARKEEHEQAREPYAVRPYVRTVDPIIDFPALAFKRRQTVERYFGRPKKTAKGFDPDGLVVWYDSAVVNYRWNRLYGMEYKFKRRKPKTIKEAIELVGLEMRTPHYSPIRSNNVLFFIDL